MSVSHFPIKNKGLSLYKYGFYMFVGHINFFEPGLCCCFEIVMLARWTPLFNGEY